ncbi:hypothetical protein C8A00DRAFT_36178 [Chaetomidium leptoderma]|uniref:DUF6590 domain-containing protein n=1 Tax=Chaetomidium leptoderma TaxID=669021 RepID=A0AAN6VGN1_9PEZI|nr:hypothetical protein C8A00DRAFT_36178 [Chaetomidium leptoderma]
MDPAWSEWGEWLWDDNRACYYRARQDTQGNPDYEWYNPNESAQAAPRGDVGDLANSFQNLGMGEDATYTQGAAYTYGDVAATAGGVGVAGVYGTSSGPAHTAFLAKGKGNRKPADQSTKSPKVQSSHKHRSRAATSGNAEPLDPFYRKADAAVVTEQTDSDDAAYEASPSNSAGPSELPHSFPPEDEEHGSGYPTQTDGVDPAFDPSREEDQDPLALADPYATGAIDAPYSGGGSSSAATAHGYSFPVYNAHSGRETPRPSAQDSATMMMANGSQYPPTTTESVGSYDLGDGYNVEHSSRFQPGEIFKIMWCEPLGAGPPKSVVTYQVRREHDGRSFYQGLRRFIVIGNDEGHCTCVPILTYEHKGCKKRGVKPLKHGIIYQAGRKPRMLEEEPELGFQPVQVRLHERAERLDKESRVNYAKLTTIEHNFRVHFIGTVEPNDFQNIVVPAVDDCWQKKKRHNYY